MAGTGVPGRKLRSGRKRGSLQFPWTQRRPIDLGGVRPRRRHMALDRMVDGWHWRTLGIFTEAQLRTIGAPTGALPGDHDQIQISADPPGAGTPLPAGGE